MPLPFGTGELANRLRRSLDLRGRIPLLIDEVVVPTMPVSDGTKAPFRTSGRRAGAFVFQAAVAGQFASFRIQNPTPVDAVLDRLSVFTASPAGSVWAIGVGAGSVAGVGTALSTTELVDASQSLILSTGLSVVAATAAASTLAVVLFGGFLAGNGVSPPPSQDVYDLDLVIPAGGALTAEIFALNSDARLAVSCRFYDDIPRLAQ